MNTKLGKLAAVLALVIGGMAIFAGGKVLLGQDPGYYVIDWVPVYNFSMGVISAALVAVLLWINSRYALYSAVAVLSAHSLVMLILQTAYREVVAPDSLRAMTIRITTWIIILSLLLVQRWLQSGSALKKTRAHG